MTRVISPAAAIRGRIFNVVPAASFQMDKLLGLLDVTCTEAVPTAAIECRTHPRLLINPRFVDEHCRRDEHLLLLVMHELYHVVLGHTRLFPRVSTAHNLAFDAVINAMLCHQFPEPGYTSFFQAINPWETWPGRLLRPPPGWPGSPQPLPPDASARERWLHDRLYGANYRSVTCQEIFELLACELAGDGALPGDATPLGDDAGQGAANCDDGGLLGRVAGWLREHAGHPSECERGGNERSSGDAVLVGDHGGDEADGDLDAAAVMDDTLRQVLRRIVEGWPPPRQKLTGRDLGREAANWWLEPARDAPSAFSKSLERLLGLMGIRTSAHSHTWRRTPALVETTRETFVPQAADRRAHAFAELHGHAPLVYHDSTRRRLLQREPEDVAHVYFDVSGSMDALVPLVAAALRRPHRQGRLRLFVFSTVVGEVRPGQLATCQLPNTFGTDIDCVLRHLVSCPRQRRPRRVLLLTDGYVGPPDQELSDELIGRGLRIFVGLTDDGWEDDLRPIAHHLERMPALKGGQP